jgi:predicted molibdopterin-dependent oxidoreductase YjgC
LGHDTGISSQPSAFAALCAAAPIYAGLTDVEIGGRGVRWQDRGAAVAIPEPDGANGTASAKAQSSGESAPSAPDRSGTFKLGTYRDLWTGPITELNPPLRFLAPQQTVEMAVADVDGLGLTAGDEVQVSQNGTSVRAKVDPKERVQAGTVFLIEGIRDGNANALLNGGPVDVTIEKVGG